MTMEGSERYYAGRVNQELELASRASEPVVKAVHLNAAARYATLRERSEDASVASNGGSAAGASVGPPCSPAPRADCNDPALLLPGRRRQERS